MLANDKYPVAQGETLIWIVGNCGVKRGMSDRDARRSSYPHFASSCFSDFATHFLK